MFKRIRYLLSDVFYWLRRHPVRGLAALLLALAVMGGAIYAGTELAGDSGDVVSTPAPDVFVESADAPESPEDLGFPAFATRNTTRVAGADSISTAAGVALATSPAGGAVDGPPAVILVDAEDWGAGIAVSSLVADPVGAPILLTSGTSIPAITQSALDALAPKGGAATGGAQVFSVGDAPEPEGLKTERIEAKSVPALAAEVASLRAELADDPPEEIVIASSDDPEYAMPAAAWAARSGDAVLFAQADSVPKVTLDALKDFDSPSVYILGSPDVISNGALKQIQDASGGFVERAAATDDPVTSAIEFARYFDGTFGWNINDPGHGFVIANLTRPSDAGAAAALSGTGTYGPLLLTDDAERMPSDLEGFLLDLKPGYEDDPTRAVYNHLWIVGDEAAISVDSQVELDAIAEVAEVESGTGEEILGAPPEPEEPEPQRDREEPRDEEQP